MLELVFLASRHYFWTRIPGPNEVDSEILVLKTLGGLREKGPEMLELVFLESARYFCNMDPWPSVQMMLIPRFYFFWDPRGAFGNSEAFSYLNIWINIENHRTPSRN